MIAGSRRGLDHSAMMRMQLGAIVDYCVEYDNQQHKAEKDEGKTRRMATPEETDAFLLSL